MEYKLYKEQGILECYAYSVKNSELEKKLLQKQQNEKLGIESDFEEDFDVEFESVTP